MILLTSDRYAVMLAFDVKLGRDVSDHAEEIGVRIFTAEIIYHLFDQFTEYMDKYNKDKQEAAAPQAVFPCRLKIAGAQFVFNKTNPIVLGVDVLEGTLKIGTPLCVPAQNVSLNFFASRLWLTYDSLSFWARSPVLSETTKRFKKRSKPHRYHVHSLFKMLKKTGCCEDRDAERGRSAQSVWPAL